MSAVTAPIPAPARSIRNAEASIPMRTLVEVELRKMVDTRAGRWLLIGVGAITVLVLGVALITGDSGTRSFTNLLAVAQLPLAILLPVLGILAATSEWTQRTVLTTFSLVPTRSRVLTAKVAAALLISLGAIVFSLIVAAIGAIVAPIFGPADSDWGIGISTLGQDVVYQVFQMLLGVALGTLLLNSALAIVLNFVLPTIWSGLTGSITSLHDVQKWLDPGTTWMHLVDPDFTMAGQAWGQILTTALFWIALPLGLGLARVLRKEVD
ncbi:MAG: hypothetical protein AAGC46_15740 [Solirubrobacteraceae bacterium]|nr:ABC transporter permease subunit [Patulibacter sp.]